MKTNHFALSVVALNLLALFCLAAQPKQDTSENIPKVLRARAFEIVDEAGKSRASITVETNGEAVFRMRDAQGTIRVKLGADERGSGLLLLDDSTEPGLHVLARRDGTTMSIYGKDGKKQVIKP